MGFALVVLLLLVITGATLAAFVDVQLQPDTAWDLAGVSRGVTTAALLFTCGIGAAYYFAVLRPRLRKAVGRG